MELADGNLYMLIFMVLMFVGVVYGYFTAGGSGIAETPYGKIYGGAPAAGRKASASGRDERIVMRDWSRGTR